ncbi:MAG: hypothetical protein M3300_08250 [Actinomycetota bacterium]|nr:hypothetical protein [Actinomycetota bacterium]
MIALVPVFVLAIWMLLAVLIHGSLFVGRGFAGAFVLRAGEFFHTQLFAGA